MGNQNKAEITTCEPDPNRVKPESSRLRAKSTKEGSTTVRMVVDALPESPTQSENKNPGFDHA